MPTGARFDHGVASGDPTHGSLILWTRVSGLASAVTVRWEIATDEAFTMRLADGETSTDAARDFTVKVDATGLPEGQALFYRFAVLDGDVEVVSPVGRGRTTGSAPSSARIGVVACASLAHGWLHGYRFLAGTELDLVLHLGDAIYEFADGEYGSLRPYEPSHECRTLEDYRRRHAQYHRDGDVQALHASHAIAMLWDDHEFANNAKDGGSGWHDPATEGPWTVRRDAARQAFFEWTPTREDPAHPDRLWRSLSLGSLATIHLVDARMDGRPPLPSDEADRLDPSRRAISDAQEAWLTEGLFDDAVRYPIVASQVLFAHHPEIWSLDAWDGFPVQRDRILSALAARPEQPLIWLTGDSHASWASELSTDPYDPEVYDPETGVGAVGVELGVPGITSPNLDPRDAPAEEARIREASPHHRYVEMSSRGYLVLTLDDTGATAQRWFVDGVESASGGVQREGPVHRVAAGTRRLQR